LAKQRRLVRVFPVLKSKFLETDVDFMFYGCRRYFSCVNTQRIKGFGEEEREKRLFCSLLSQRSPGPAQVLGASGKEKEMTLVPMSTRRGGKSRRKRERERVTSKTEGQEKQERKGKKKMTVMQKCQ